MSYMRKLTESKIRGWRGGWLRYLSRCNPSLRLGALLLLLVAANSLSSAQSLATMIYPAPGDINIPLSGNTFSWNPVSTAQAYYLYVGSAPGLKDVFNSGSKPATITSVKIPAALASGTTYYVRIWTFINGHWASNYVDSTFTSVIVTAFMTYPLDGARKIDPYLTATWNTVKGATYVLNIGSSPGGSDVFSSGTLGTTSVLVTGLLGFSSYYVRLWTQTPAGSTFADSIFSTGPQVAHLITPGEGATNVDPFASFSWNSVPDAQAYYLKVGTKSGVFDVHNSSVLPADKTSRLVPGLIGSQTYYATLSTKINGVFYPVSSTFQTAPQPLPDPDVLHTTAQNQTQAVRMMTLGMTNIPIPGTLLAQIVADDGRTVAFCTEYAKTLVQLLMGQRISVRLRISVFNGVESHTMAEYYDPFLSKWVVLDPTFGLVLFSTTAGQYFSIDDMAAAVAAQNWPGIPLTQVTVYGTQVANSYYMDPSLLYLNPLPPATNVLGVPLANSPTFFMVNHPMTDVGTYGFYVFGFSQTADSVSIIDPRLGPLTIMPRNGTLYSSDTRLNKGWSIASSPSGLTLNTIGRYMF